MTMNKPTEGYVVKSPAPPLNDVGKDGGGGGGHWGN